MTRLMQDLTHYLLEDIGLGTIFMTPTVPIRLPSFLRELYTLEELSIRNLRCLLLIHRGQGGQPPLAIDKHMSTVRAKWEGPVIYVADRITSYQRKRLIALKVPFIVPGSQCFLPFLGLDFREQFPAARLEARPLLPAAQAAILHWIYHGFSGADTPSALAARLGYSKMSATRVFNEVEVSLTDLKEFRVNDSGRERRAICTASAHDLWKAALPLMRSPVRRRLRVDPVAHQVVRRPLAGLSGLAELTNLNAPSLPTYAEGRVVDLNRARPALLHKDNQNPSAPIVEIWRYAPTLHQKPGSKDARTADPLSLYLSLASDGGPRDERVEMALDELMKGLVWR